MSNPVKITYVNHSMNQDLPSIFLFLKNEVPTFDALREGVAWRVLKDVGRGSSATFIYSSSSDGHCLCIPLLNPAAAKKYTDQMVTKAMEEAYQAYRTAPDSELLDQDNGLSAAEAGKPAPASRMYWALAADGQEDGAAVPDPKSLFELNLEGVTEVTVGLYGNPQEGYHFKIDSMR